MITQERLKEVLSYCPEKGTFLWEAGSYVNHKEGSPVGWKEKTGYVRVMIDGKRYSLHRLAFLYMTGSFPEDQVDHINRIKWDNRWSNLRDSDNRMNALNRTNSRKHSYVYETKAGYRVSVGTKHLGSFRTIGAALYARDFYLGGSLHANG